MKTSKLIIGIISIVLSIMVLFQSCAAAFGDAIVGEGGTSGGSGIICAIIMLVTGIVSIAARTSKGASIFCSISFFVGGIIALASRGIFKDLLVWGTLCMIFGAVYLIFAIRTKSEKAMSSEVQNIQPATLPLPDLPLTNQADPDVDIQIEAAE